jgi:hypothetical protein
MRFANRLERFNYDHIRFKNVTETIRTSKEYESLFSAFENGSDSKLQLIVNPGAGLNPEEVVRNTKHRFRRVVDIKGGLQIPGAGSWPPTTGEPDAFGKKVIFAIHKSSAPLESNAIGGYFGRRPGTFRIIFKAA